MNKRIFIVLLFFITGTIISHGQNDPLFNVLKSELDRNFSILKNQPIPAYYISLRLDEVQTLNCVARLGRLQTSARLESPSHVLSSGMRVGDRNLDNTHEIRDSGYGSYRDVRINTQYVPIDNNPTVLKNTVWLQLDELYKQDIQIYEQIKANMAVKVEQEDKSPDFSEEIVENYSEVPLKWENLNINAALWEDKVRLYSKVFDENEDLLDGVAYLMGTLSRRTFVDTEGREMAQNDVSFQLVLTAETQAEDGMFLPLYKSWTAFSTEELPSDEEVIKAAREMSQTLSDLKKAPLVESFTGPAILSPEATGVFFHEIFGHRVEGSRLKEETDAQTFKKKIGERVLPKHLSVTFDPTLKYYKKTPLAGNYVFDDEGIIAQKVEVVKNGILSDFLMGRTPIEGFLHSNGHGRAQIGAAPISRQSNMLVESSQKFTEKELISKLKKEAKSQGKEYAYYFKEVSGGFTNTNRYSPNAFNVSPLIVYRIYTDNRPAELVRGVDLVGTPLAMFSQIEACGAEYSVFNGVCGAESGSIPVSCVAPSLFVKQIETQKRAKSQSLPLILPKPVAIEKETRSESDIIARSIKTEVNRAQKELKMEGLKPPFFIAYTLRDVDQLFVTASNGSIVNSAYSPYRGGGTRLLIGDYSCTDENFNGNAGGGASYDGQPCLDNDEQGIRYTIWRDIDAVYKSAAETYEQKMAAIKQLNIPEKDLEIPDWDKTPVVVMNNLPVSKIDLNKSRFETYAKEASTVFDDYKDILTSNVSVHVYNSVVYFYNTEGSEFRYPFTFANLNISAHAKTAEGEDISHSFDLAVSHPDELPSLEELKIKCKKVAEKLQEEVNAPKFTESYSGPVLFENLAVVRTFYGNFFSGDISLIAERKPLSAYGYSYGGNSLEEMMGKRITAREISIVDMTGTPEYKRIKLMGYVPIDGEAVIPPAELVLVENGILKTLLNDRIPTPKVPHSNGHALLSAGGGAFTSAGVVRMTDTRQKTKEELRKALFERAKEEGYEYAYIVRDAVSLGAYPTELYQVDLKTRNEKRVRSAIINNVDAQIFKSIVAVSDQEYIYNGISGNPLSIIVPDAILFEELQIQSDRIDNYKKPPLVSLH